MKVWVLTSGEYSDYRIEGIFSSREAAERILLRARADKYATEFNDPEGYEVDALADHTYGPSFRMLMRLDTGEAMEGYTSSPELRHPGRCEVEFRDIAWSRDEHAVPCVCVTSPISREHAVKVAVEKRQEWLRTRDLVSD